MVVAGRMTSAILLGLIVAACAGDGLRTDRQMAHERVNAYLAAHSNTPPELVGYMRSFQLKKGMTKDQVIATWGKPAVVNKSHGGTVDYWLFGCDWPHHCLSMGGRRKGRSSEDVYQSNALFQDGKLVEWSK